MSIFGGMQIRRPLAGMRRRKTHRKVGKGFWDTLKNIGSTVGNFALPILKDVGVSLIKKRIGLGRKRRRVVRRKTGGAKIMSTLRHMYGGVKRRVKKRRVGRGILSDLLGQVGLGRKKRVVRRRRMLV